MAHKYMTLTDYSNTPLSSLVYHFRYSIISICTVVVIVFAVFIVGSQLQAKPYSDGAYYLVVAKSVTQGTGFRVISSPDMPFATISPLGYPLLLSGLVRVFGVESTAPYRLLSIIFWLGTIIMIGTLVAREDGQVWGLLVAFLTALNIIIMEFAKEILTELPYMFVAGIVIFMVYKYAASQATSRWLWLVPIVFGLSILVNLRLVGISLVAAVTVYLFIQRQFKAGFLIGSILALVSLPLVLIWNPNALILGQWFRNNIPFDLDAQVEPAGKVFVERLATNMLYYIAALSRNIFGWRYFEDVSSKEWYYYVLGFVLVILPILVGWWIKAKSSKANLIPLYMGFYLPILLILVPKGIARYLVPLLPFMIWYFLIGAATIIGTIGTRVTSNKHNLRRQRLVFFAITIGLVYSLLFSAFLVGLARFPIILGKMPPERQVVHSYLLAADWLRDNTPSDAIILARKMDSVYLRSGRQAVRYPYTTDHDLFISFLDHYAVSYIILDNLGFDSREKYLLPFLESHQQALEEVFRTPDEITIIYQLNRERLNN